MCCHELKDASNILLVHEDWTNRNYSVKQSDRNSFCSDVVLDSVNKESSADEDNSLRL